MKTITFKNKAGLSITMPASDKRSALLSESAIYNKKMIDSLLRLGIDLELAIDVGANCGQSALTYSRYFRKVISFEPVPDLFRCLQHNITSNRVENVSTINAAVGEKSDRDGVVFRFSEKNHFGSKVAINPKIGKTITVPLVNLDKAIEGTVPTFIKIDVEGFEYRVIRGALNLIKSHHPVMLIELVPEFMKGFGAHPQDVFSFLGKLGYCVYDTKLRKLSIAQWEFMPRERDRLFIHKSTPIPKKGFGLTV